MLDGGVRRWCSKRARSAVEQSLHVLVSFFEVVFFSLSQKPFFFRVSDVIRRCSRVEVKSHFTNARRFSKLSSDGFQHPKRDSLVRETSADERGMRPLTCRNFDKPERSSRSNAACTASRPRESTAIDARFSRTSCDARLRPDEREREREREREYTRWIL